MEWFHKKLAEAWTIEVRGVLGPPHVEDTVQEMTVLNRLLTWSEKGIDYEADPRHAQRIFSDLRGAGEGVKAGCEGEG